MPVIPRLYSRIRAACQRTQKRMEENFERIRPDLISIAKNCYPLALRGLEQRVDRDATNSRTDSISGDYRLLDPTPITSLKRGAAGFHGNLTSPARKWFRLGLLDVTAEAEESSAASDIRAHLDRVTKTITWLLHHCGIYQQLHILYTHLLAFGFAAMLVLEDRLNVVRAITLRMGTYALDVDNNGMVDRLCRRFQITGEQLLKEFGEDCMDPYTVASIKRGDQRDYIVVNIIEPNWNGQFPCDDVTKMVKLDASMAWRSIYFLENYSEGPCKGVIRISGFPINPIIAPRMNRENGDIYGSGSGHEALAVMRGLQAVAYDSLEASSKVGAPPILASSDFAEEGVNLERGGLNFGSESIEKSFIQPIFKGADSSIEICRFNKEEMTAALNKIFFNDILSSINVIKDGNMTATEVDQRVREGMLMLGPVITSLDPELLDLLIKDIRYYAEHVNIAPYGQPARALIETPAEIAGIESATKIEYVSSIHLAQRATELGVIERFIEFCAAASKISQNAVDNIDIDQMLRDYARILGVQEKYLRKLVDVKAVRKALADREIKMAEAEQNAKSLEAMAKAGAVSTDKTIAGQMVAAGGAK